MEADMDRPLVSPSMQIILELIDQSYQKKAWHGPNLRGSIRGLSVREALRRPSPARHNIWEIVVHCAYWKYIVRRRITGERRGSFPVIGSNWFRRSGALSEEQWRDDIRLLSESHRSLRQAITALGDMDLNVTPAGSKVSNAVILTGIAAHDVYHAGQIQLLKRLIK
jgi:uncharacterized damage-inducible protein DinB